jgi:hypothetical protein
VRSYRLIGTVTISVSTIVEAETEEEAVALAQERSVMGLCYHCADGHGICKEWVTSGELDGEPTNLEVAP